VTERKGFMMVLPVILLACVTSLSSQNSKKQSQEDVLTMGDIANHNIQDALEAHAVSDPGFNPQKRQPVEQVRGFDTLVYKNSFKLDWTTGQHARYLMEELRQGIHELQSATHPQGLDGMALEGARSAWPKLRDVVCTIYPGVRYFDLNGSENYCADAPNPAKTQ
jgi:hypothetical protein